jgi:hypothetical protein
MSPASITVLLTLLDDAYFLPEWAECVRRIAPEQVLVVDGGSKDGGPEYLETQNLPNLQIVSCPMESIDWDKSAMLNRSLDFARKDWILLLDADEVLWPPGRQWLDAALQHRPRGVVSLFLPRFHLYKNDRTRLVNRGSLDPQPRFWNRTAGIRWSRKAHPLQHLGDQGILGMHRNIGSDSGPTHAAAALGVPVIGLDYPSDRIRPFADPTRFIRFVKGESPQAILAEAGRFAHRVCPALGRER